MIGEKAKIKPATVIQVVKIDLNWSNKVFTYKKWYLKSVHTFRQPLQVVGAADGQKKTKKRKRSLQQKGG